MSRHTQGDFYWALEGENGHVNFHHPPGRTASPMPSDAQYYPQERADYAAASRAHYRFRKHALRSLLNIIGPIVVVLFYSFTIFHYLRRPAVNGIIPDRIIDGKTVFYTWIIIAVFLLDWAKSGLAGLEAAALMRPALAPSNARQLLWHSDKAWGAISGWWKAFLLSTDYLTMKMAARQHRDFLVIWRGPGLLWWYLAISSFLFYAAVPLMGLSIDQKEALRRSTRPARVSGVNQTTFNLRSWGNLPEEVDRVWRQGNPASPFGETVFYAPEGSSNITSTYYEDTIQDVYQRQRKNVGIPINQTISFFSGPEVTERAFGSAWGLLTDISCSPMSPYSPRLQLLKVASVNKWTAEIPGLKESGYPYNSTGYAQKPELAQVSYGLTGLYRGIGQSFGVSYQYLVASDFRGYESSSSYSEHPFWPLPIHGTFETVLWQGYKAKPGHAAGSRSEVMDSHPLVEPSVADDNMTYLGYAVQCTVVSDVGFAKVSADTITFKDFQRAPALNNETTTTDDKVVDWQGVQVMHALVYASLTWTMPQTEQVSKCNSNVTKTCNPWMGVSMALNMDLNVAGDPKNRRLQLPIITPEQMTLAMYKLFGVAAAVMMGPGPGNWTSEDGLYGLSQANDLVTGKVPYQFVGVLLLLWVALTALPQVWALLFWGRRWSGTLDGFVLFRLGAEWRGAVHELSSDNLGNSGTDCLMRVPGLVGEMQNRSDGLELQGGHLYAPAPPHRNSRFVGLSNVAASNKKGRIYWWN